MIKNKRVISYRHSDNRGVPIPCLPIEGKFMNKINFPIGAQVELQYSDGFIHISRVLNSGRYEGLASAVLVNR
jgi:hypothetical protein